MHHDVADGPTVPMEVVHSSDGLIDAIHDVAANMEVSSSESSSSPSKEVVLGTIRKKITNKKLDQVPKVHIQKVVISSSSATQTANNNSTINSTTNNNTIVLTNPTSSPISATSTTPVSVTPVQCILRHAPSKITVDVSKLANPARFLQIAPKTQGTSLLSPIRIQWPTTGNITTILQYSPTTAGSESSSNSNSSSPSNSNSGVSSQSSTNATASGATLQQQVTMMTRTSAERQFFKTIRPGARASLPLHPNPNHRNPMATRCIRAIGPSPAGGIPASSFYAPNHGQQQVTLIEPQRSSSVHQVTIRKRPRLYGARRTEPECLTISSDDEESEDSKIPMPPPTKEGSLVHSQMANRFKNMRDKDGNLMPADGEQDEEGTPSEKGTSSGVIQTVSRGISATTSTAEASSVERIELRCRSIRIGSYRVPVELACPVTFEKGKMAFVVPSVNDVSAPVHLQIRSGDVLNMLAHLGKSMPALFIYTTEGCAELVRSKLGMTREQGSEYFDPQSQDEAQKRITMLPIIVEEDQQAFLRTHFRISEIEHKTANMILVRSTPSLLPESVDNKPSVDSSPSSRTIASRIALLSRASSNVRFAQVSVCHFPPLPCGLSLVSINCHQEMAPLNVERFQQQPQTSSTPFSSLTKEIETVLTYPPPPQSGRISITTEDLECLNEGEFLNDVIIDFYLSYLVNEMLTEKDKQRTHVFSSFFYPCLTQKVVHRDSYESTKQKTPQERRHWKVRTWTRHVDIFEKDFIIIPINQNAHWFLAIICFPGLVAASQPNASLVAASEGPSHSAADDNDSTSSQVALAEEDFAQEDESMQCDEPEADSEDPLPPSQPSSAAESAEQVLEEGVVKRPCILIFDSLAGSSRARIMTSLREYLAVEWQVRKGSKVVFNATTMRGFTPHVPQQTNYSDCGVYVLQYVESFFETPVLDFNHPTNLKEWFTTERAGKKRAELRDLIHRLSSQQSKPSDEATASTNSSSIVTLSVDSTPPVSASTSGESARSSDASPVELVQPRLVSYSSSEAEQT